MKPNLLTALTDNIKVDPEKCIACGKCVDVCVLDNLRLRLAPCQAACPLGVNCQGYVRLIARGEEAKARKILFETCPLPGVLAELCSRPCEARCRRRERGGQAVAIRALKRYLLEGGDEGAALPARAPEMGKRVAVIGSGPAGLTAAHDLALDGHDVTVFEAEDHPGGRLRRAIEEGRLPPEVFDREIDRLKRLGVKFDFKARLGKDLSLEELLARRDAAIVAPGRGADLDATADPRVFPAGESVSGPLGLVDAMASGRRAARRASRRRLDRTALDPGPAPGITDFEPGPGLGSDLERMPDPKGPIAPETARAEASRCHGCGGPVGYYRTCWFCLPCEVECPEQAIWVEVPYLLR